MNKPPTSAAGFDYTSNTGRPEGTPKVSLRADCDLTSQELAFLRLLNETPAYIIPESVRANLESCVRRKLPFPTLGMTQVSRIKAIAQRAGYVPPGSPNYS